MARCKHGNLPDYCRHCDKAEVERLRAEVKRLTKESDEARRLCEQWRARYMIEEPPEGWPKHWQVPWEGE